MPLGTGRDDNVTVTLGVANATITRKAIVDVDLDTTDDTTTSPWLIHNPDSPPPPGEVAPSPLETLKFPPLPGGGDGNGTGGSGWTGFGETGHVVDGNASRTTNTNRLGW